mmetsp:Transcript_25479/g.46897  ORF Transcript_25479/g.46897 Transcript_25479/m.46897 type:complete len:89 (-) Transcript_25479:349-615(-)
MMRSLFLLAILVAAASAFVAPATTAVAGVRAVETPNMMIDGSIMESAANTANLIATSSADNGGAFFPVAGIVSLAALILYLAPPLVED